MQFDGACRRIDELEARLAENASQASNFIGQTAHEAKAMMQAATNANDELRHKLTHHEQEAHDMRKHFANTEHQLLKSTGARRTTLRKASTMSCNA